MVADQTAQRLIDFTIERDKEIARAVNDIVQSFNQIQDRETRYRFNAMPTTFRLTQAQVDDVIADAQRQIGELS